MIRKLNHYNVREYFSNYNIVMLVLSEDRNVYRNLQLQFFKPLVYCANYVTKDLQLSRELAQSGINELILLIRNGMPIVKYDEQLYCLVWQKILVRLYQANNRDYLIALKDSFMRGQIMAEMVRDNEQHITGDGWFRKIAKKLGLVTTT